MTQRTHPRHTGKPNRTRRKHDRPERHTIAQIGATIPRHHETTRISGVLATLDRIASLPSIRW